MIEHEELLIRRGERSGVQIAIAVNSTALGPALGGCRMWHYEHEGDGIEDALRLAQAMTLKAAAAGLDLGGGKGVICLPEGEITVERRHAALLDFADAVELLEGRYITAEDVGTSAEDMAVFASRTSRVVGLPESLGGRGDPSPITARGVERAITACVAHRFGTTDLAGMRICVIGLGHVGAALARRLRLAGADLLISDIDPSRRSIGEELGARWVDPEGAILADCEVIAPCALGGVIDERNADLMRCAIVCGAANNVLSEDSVAERLRERGMSYAPDFIANAGGLIHVYAELHGHSTGEVDALVDSLGETTLQVLRDAEARGTTPLQAARELAKLRLDAVAAAPAA